MRAGKLRRSITIQQPANATDAIGGLTQVWSTFASGYAEISPNNGREAIQAQQINAQQPILIRTRYIAGVMPKMRVLYGSRIFEIISVANLNEKNRELEFTCLEHQ
jgi:SPP1 family predicted phage head-tail adaptor